MTAWLPLVVLAAAWLALIALVQPRAVLYTIIALAPTQFLFVPVSTFSLSLADVLVCSAAVALVVRLTTWRTRPWQALRQHRFVVLMLLSYVIGFFVLDVFSRTFIRLPLAVAVSVLAVEVLETRAHLARAAMALVAAGAIDAGYGLFFVLRGTPLHPYRFSGMSDVNFAGMLIGTSAVVALALIARTHRPARLLQPALLAMAAIATLSQMVVLALGTAWVAVLRRVVSRPNKVRIISVTVVAVAIALSVAPVRERVFSRDAPQMQADGIARSSADVRWMILEASWRAFKASPVFGLGYYGFVPFSNTNADVRASTAGQGYPTHNSYVEVLVEGGLIAFGCFMLHWWQYVRAFPRAMRIVSRNRDALAAACLVGFPVMMVSAALANVLLVYSFWAVCGLALACLNILRREDDPSRPLHVAAPPGAS